MYTYMVTWHMNTIQDSLPHAAPHPPSPPIDNPIDCDRTGLRLADAAGVHGTPGTGASTNNSNETDASRCQFSFSDGRQCRMPRASSGESHERVHPHFCLYHATKEEELYGLLYPREATANSAELEPMCGELSTATDVNRALAQAFRLLARGRISRRDAVAFGYLGQLMLQSVPGVRAEYVAAFGYRAWQENLTIRLGSSGSAAKGCQQDALSPLNKVNGSGESLRERGLSAASPLASPSAAPVDPAAASPEPPAPNKIPVAADRKQEIPAHHSAESVSAAPADPGPDFESLLSRSLDAFDGRFDTTPEGRRELHRLMFDLEELAPTAMPRSSIEARVSATLSHIRKNRENESAGEVGVESAPSYRNY
jgi:hypothetical protein